MKRILPPLLLFFLLVGICGCSAAPAEMADPSPSEGSSVYTLSPRDLQTAYTQEQDISLEENEIFTITQPGVYRLSGQQTGQVCIDVQDEIVSLILDNVHLQSYNGPAIYVRSAAKLVITIPEGTSSTVTDSGFYESQTTEDACIFSTSDLTINGTGSLDIRGNYADAIRSKDVLKVLGATLNIRAKRHGLRGADGVILESVAADLQCEGNGLYTSKENRPGRGFVSISGGSLKVVAGKYGISAAENLYLQDCTASIYGVQGNIQCKGSQQIQEGCLQ